MLQELHMAELKDCEALEAPPWKLKEGNTFMLVDLSVTL